jgi:cold shock CspA family protein
MASTEFKRVSKLIGEYQCLLAAFKWFSLEKGFGFISNDEGEDVYLAAAALPEGVTTVKPRNKIRVQHCR